MNTVEDFVKSHVLSCQQRISLLRDASVKIWNKLFKTPFELQEHCKASWEEMAGKIGSRIKPLVPVDDSVPVGNLIFGSGSFSTGKFQAGEFKRMEATLDAPPVSLLGIVTNKSIEHGCNAARVASDFLYPLVELDFKNWYQEHVDASETHPTRATRYWFRKNDPAKPDGEDLARRFKIRQEHFHGDLGDLIDDTIGLDASSVSARGYNFQFCSSIFKHQSILPHINDTHPADLSFVDGRTGEKLYPGWQQGAIELMLQDGHDRFRGSLIEVDFMDSVDQIHDLDEGALLALGEGVSIKDSHEKLPAKAIQDAMKLVDDFTFCMLEPTGLILAWGITEDPVDVTFKTLDGTSMIINQRGIIVGDTMKSGKEAWGTNLVRDLDELVRFLES
ncbi:hypothetical protein GF325_08935 [Candidatus Bathyarchaeota archaeon]|nr:hypothetical protein [Candidatus Bathyarchaeota archaeon]